MPGFGRGEPAMLPSLGRGLFEGMTWFVAYMGFPKDGDALRIWLFCMASIWACWAWEYWAWVWLNWAAPGLFMKAE